MKRGAALLFLLPALTLYAGAFLIPMVLVGRLSLFETDYVLETFVGARNFIRAFADKRFLKSFVNVLILLVPLIPITILMTYGVTSWLTRFGTRAQGVGRFLSYMPSLTSGLVISLLWRWMLKSDGLFNQFIVALGGEPLRWLGTPWLARLSMMLVALSNGPGALVILFFAAIKSMPEGLHEAAIIDGASESQYRRYIVRPFIMPTILLVVLLIMIGTIQVWETVYVLTGDGGPKGSTATPVYDVFLTAFVYNEPGYAMAKGIILLVLITGLVFLKRKAESWVGADR